MIGSIQEILCLLLAVQLDSTKMAEREIKGFIYTSRTALAEPEYALRLAAHSWRTILPPLLTSSPSKMLWRQYCPSRAGRSTAAARPRDLRSCALMPEDAPLRPLSPLRYPPRSTNLSILSRSLARPRNAEQRGSDDQRKGRVV
jgi:hypothetical protein